MANTLKFGSGQWATKVGSTLAYNDEGGNFKPLPFNFTRSTSATRVNKDGLIEVVTNNKPRIDFLNDSNGALLLEPSRTNLITYSEDFSQGYWSKSRATILSNQTISPDGTLTADLLTITDTPENYTQTNVSVTVSGAIQTVSCFVKKGTNDFAHILLWDTSSNGSRQWFDVNNGTVGSSAIFGSGISVNSASIENYGNGWFRCIVVFNCSLTSVRTRISASNGDGQTNGTIGKTIFIWGYQLESNSSYATSYIPTQGAIATRVVESFTTSLPDTASFNSSNGFSVISKFGIGNAGSGTSAPFISFNDDTSNTYIGFGSNSSNFRCRLNLNGVSYLNTQDNAQRTQENSLFVSCDTNGWSQGANGVTNHTGNNDASIYNKLSNITYISAEVYGVIKIKELSVYNTRLTNAELQALTIN